MQVANENAKLNVYCDLNAESPRTWDNVGTMVCWHRRYAFGDKHDHSGPQAFLESADAKAAYVMLPVYLYDHSAQKLSNQPFTGRAPHAEWDSGQVGFIYVNRGKVKELTGLEPTEQNKDAVTQMLTAETELYSSYIEGDCYGYTIEDLEGNLLDNCGGFYGGDMSDILRQMKEHVGTEYDALFTKMQGYVKTLHAAMT